MTTTSDIKVTLTGCMGQLRDGQWVPDDDLTVLNAAKASFSRQANTLGPKERRLIQYLGEHQHTSPFRHPHFRFIIEAPEFVMRQLYKHVVGIESTSAPSPCKDHAWSEQSQRFRPAHEVYVPETWRRQHTRAKQCSGGELGPAEQKQAAEIYRLAMTASDSAYRTLLGMGVAREMARLVKPLSTMTRVVWTASLQAIAHFVALRDHADAQPEITTVATQLAEAVRPFLPVAWDTLLAGLRPPSQPKPKPSGPVTKTNLKIVFA